MNEFGAYIKKIRESKGLTLNQVALYSDISAAQLSRIENGKRGVPKPSTIKGLAEALKCDYNELMKIAGYLDDSLRTIYFYNPNQNPTDDWALYPISDNDLILRTGTIVVTNATSDLIIPYDMSISELLKYLSKNYDVKVPHKDHIKIAGTHKFINQQDSKAIINKNEKDIAKRLKDFKEELEQQDGLLFSGEPMSEEAKESLLEAMEYAFRQTQRINKKYIPKKYRKDDDVD